VPGVEAVIVSAIIFTMKRRNVAGSGHGRGLGLDWVHKLEWLNRMLWGGVLLLGIEHVWHGEITFWPPFLTAMQNPAETELMLHEMATVGVVMALFVTIVWFIGTVIADRWRGHEPASTAPAR
jgi:hypothetical protein